MDWWNRLKRRDKGNLDYVQYHGRSDWIHCGYFLLDKGAILSESEIHKREMDDDIDG